MSSGRALSKTFGNLQELTALAEKWSAARLVEIWSSLPGVQPCSDSPTAKWRPPGSGRPFSALRPAATETGRVAAKRSSVGRKAPPAARKHRGGNSKIIRVIALLRRPQGAALQAIMKATFPRTTRGRRPVWLESLLPPVRRSFVRR
jgi:hypothetical protein